MRLDDEDGQRWQNVRAFDIKKMQPPGSGASRASSLVVSLRSGGCSYHGGFGAAYPIPLDLRWTLYVGHLPDHFFHLFSIVAGFKPLAGKPATQQGLDPRGPRQDPPGSAPAREPKEVLCSNLFACSHPSAIGVVLRPSNANLSVKYCKPFCRPSLYSSAAKKEAIIFILRRI